MPTYIVSYDLQARKEDYVKLTGYRVPLQTQCGARPAVGDRTLDPIRAQLSFRASSTRRDTPGQATRSDERVTGHPCRHPRP